MLARYMEESLGVPTATTVRTIAVTGLEARRRALKEAGAKVSFTHLIAYAIARAATEQPVMADHFAEVDGRPARIRDAGVNLGLAVDVERRDGSRTLMVPVIRDAGRLRFDEFLAAYDALVAKARTNTLVADDLVGANVTLTNPGGLGTTSSVPRLMAGQGTIVATGQIGYPPGLAPIGAEIGAEKVMTLTSTYDHRVIQGAESGRFLGRVEGLLAGEDGFYEDVFAALGLALVPIAPSSHAAVTRAAPAEPPSEELLQAAATANALVRSLRTHGHLAASLDPLDSTPQGDPALDPAAIGLTPELMAQIPSKLLHIFVEGAVALRRRLPAPCATPIAERSPINSSTLPPISSCRWLREKIESGAFRAAFSEAEQRAGC